MAASRFNRELMRHKNSPGRAKKIPATNWAHSWSAYGTDAWRPEPVHPNRIWVLVGCMTFSHHLTQRKTRLTGKLWGMYSLALENWWILIPKWFSSVQWCFLTGSEWNWNVDKWSMCLILAHACDLVSFLPWLQATAAKARKAEQANSKPKLPPTDRPGSHTDGKSWTSQGERGTRWLQVNAGRWKIWACSVRERERDICIYII